MFIERPRYRLSRTAQQLQRSIMRDLLKHAVDPGMISLAGGLPASDLLPTRALDACLHEVLRRDGGTALQYSPQWPLLRQWIADYMRTRDVDCSPEQVFITNGNQHGLQILSRLFVDDDSDVVVTEQAVFTGIKQVTAGRGCRVRTVPTDLQTGVDIDALEAAFAAPEPPRMAVFIPDFHNPLSVTISREKRQRIAALAAHYGVPVIEDDAYSALRFEGESLSPIKAYDKHDFVFFLGSFSKMLSPGLRLGWMVVPESLMPKVTVLRESFDLETSTLIQRSVAEFLYRDELTSHLTRLNAANRERRDALLAALDANLRGIATWTEPQGGLFVWVTLPSSVDTWELLPQAIDNKVVYVPGAAFAVDGGLNNTMRLNFSSVPPAQFDEAISRLGQVINSAL